MQYLDDPFGTRSYIHEVIVEELWDYNDYQPINPFYHNSGEIVPSDLKRKALRKKRKLKIKRN